jgi:hypothetical protein
MAVPDFHQGVPDFHQGVPDFHQGVPGTILSRSSYDVNFCGSRDFLGHLCNINIYIIYRDVLQNLDYHKL